MIVDPSASVAPAAAGAVPVASPPVLAALASVVLDPSQVEAAVTASQQSSAVAPVTPDPLFWVLVALAVLPLEQETSLAELVLPSHLPVTASPKAPTVAALAPLVQTLPLA
jgi:H+/gluconate symporter-like permease